jgi:aminobenzoyl-glutamate utilization protein B
MNIGANYLREHVPQDTRIHYDRRRRPAERVPPQASSWYYVRADRHDTVEEVSPASSTSLEGRR